MGKLKDLLDEFKATPNHSTRDSELREAIFNIVDWMKANGHLDKPFKLPSKYIKNYFPLLFLESVNSPKGFYCGVCSNKVDLDMKNCLKCGMGLGAVVYHD